MIDRFGALLSWLLRSIGHYVFYDPVVWSWRNPVTAGCIVAGMMMLFLIGWLIDRPGQRE